MSLRINNNGNVNAQYILLGFHQIITVQTHFVKTIFQSCNLNFYIYFFPLTALHFFPAKRPFRLRSAPGRPGPVLVASETVELPLLVAAGEELLGVGVGMLLQLLQGFLPRGAHTTHELHHGVIRNSVIPFMR